MISVCRYLSIPLWWTELCHMFVIDYERTYTMFVIDYARTYTMFVIDYIEK